MGGIFVQFKHASKHQLSGERKDAGRPLSQQRVWVEANNTKLPGNLKSGEIELQALPRVFCFPWHSHLGPHFLFSILNWSETGSRTQSILPLVNSHRLSSDLGSVFLTLWGVTGLEDWCAEG